MATGPIEQSLAGVTDPKEHARIRAQGLRDAFAALPAGQRVAFAYDGLQVQITAQPVLLRDRQGRIVGIQIQARARDVNGNLPFIDGIHRVVNPPVKIPDGTTSPVTQPDGSSVEVANFVEDPVTALKMWLVDSIRTEARAAGWKG